jgi:hypothetical protein
MRVPRYYFHTDNSHSLRDRDGVELADVEAARHEAVRALGEILKERVDEFWHDGTLRMCVADADGLTLFLVEVSATAAPSVS